MSPDAEFLISIFQRNRVKHGEIWDKIRRDRIHKLLPRFDEHAEVEHVISECIFRGQMETCWLDDFSEWERHPAIKLVSFQHTPPTYG